MIIRWICEKCSKKWIYPVEKCIYCKDPITKQAGRKIKVIGITRVSIPSPMHPIVPYNVLLLQDEHGNRMPKKTMKSYKIGDRYTIEKAKSDGAVIITKIKYDLGEALKESLELLDSSGIIEGDKVLIKPSIIEPAYEYQAVNTSPRLLDELIGYLKEKGVTDIVVAEQSMPGNDVAAAAKKSGILDVCKKQNIQFLDLGKAEYTEKSYEGLNFKIAKAAFERKLINVPVMKTNSQIGISGAMENMIRITDDETQKSMFSNDIEKTLPKLFKVLPEMINIGDAILGIHGQGPTASGEPAFLNMIFASKDPVALDAVFSETGMLKIPQYIKESGSIGAGSSNIGDIEIIGDELDAARFYLKPAEKNKSPHPRINLIDGKANPYDFNSALKMSSKLVGLAGTELNLVIGPIITKEMVEGKERLMAYGNDAIRRLRDLGIQPLAEIREEIDDIEKIMILKSVLENPKKERITATDRLKSKMAKFGLKIKSAL